MYGPRRAELRFRTIIKLLELFGIKQRRTFLEKLIVAFLDAA